MIKWDFAGLNRQLLSRGESLLKDWFPNGHKRGHEFVVGNLSGREGDSMSINIATGVWCDFSSGEKGADLIDLYAAIHSISLGDAAKKLGASTLTSAERVSSKQSTPSPQLPAPSKPSHPPDTHGATAVYRYSDTYYVARFDTEKGKKFTPYTWDGERWNRKAPAKPRPLYNLDAIIASSDTVLIVEGEKCADAAIRAGHLATTWHGGAQAVATANWAALTGRTVVIFPDADEPGRKAAADIAGILLPIGKSVSVVDVSDAPAQGYDIADAIQDGIDTHAYIAERLRHIPRPVTTAAKQATPAEPPYVLWERLQLARNDKGPYATEANALRILAAHESYSGRIWLDEFSQKLMIDDAHVNGGSRLFSRTDAIAILIWMQESLQLPKMPLSAVERAALVIGERNKRHPVKQWLNSLKWDGIERLNDLLPLAFGAQRSAYSSAVGRCWFIGLVARIYQPGCKFDNVPVFEGPQGINKSSALSVIGGPWFLETTENPIRNRKDFLLATQGKWVIEIPEIDKIGGRHGSLEDLTGIITIRNDTYRVPYGVSSMDYPRQWVACGTANTSQWQPDVTGGRRFWPVTCGTIELEWLTDSRSQLFAEAAHLYQSGAAWWDIPTDEAKQQQDERRESDAWEDLIAAFILRRPYRHPHRPNETSWVDRDSPLSEMSIPDIMGEALNMPESRWDRASQMRISKCLTALGWVRHRVTENGARVWKYRRRNNNLSAKVD